MPLGRRPHTSSPVRKIGAGVAVMGFGAALLMMGLGIKTLTGGTTSLGWSAPSQGLARFEYAQPGLAPHTLTEEDRFSRFGVAVGTESPGLVEAALARGLLPFPPSVRTEELVNALSYEYPMPSGEAPFAVVAEGVPNPWAHHRTLLRIGVQAAAAFEAGPVLQPTVAVEFDPDAVLSYRLLGYEMRQREDGLRTTGTASEAAGLGRSGAQVTVLYDVVLSEGAAQSPEGRTLATVRLQAAGDGTQPGEQWIRRLDGRALRDDLAQASPSTIKAVAVAAFSEKLRGSPHLQDHSHTAILRTLVQAGESDPEVQALGALVHRAALVSGEPVAVVRAGPTGG